jgi:malate dehydrogenase
MIPLTRLATRNSVPISSLISADRMEEVKQETKVGGATLTKLLGTSAWYAPGAAVASMVHAIATDSHKMFASSCLLEGEFGLNDICIGVPAIIGANGIEQIVEIDLADSEKSELQASAEAVRKTNALL